MADVHPIHRVVAFEQVAPFTLVVRFEDGSSQRIDFSSVLRGELYGPLASADFFARVSLDEEAGTLVWPNGADFDPAILHGWTALGKDLAALARRWPEPSGVRRAIGA